jgi:hypothetical protein
MTNGFYLSVELRIQLAVETSFDEEKNGCGKNTYDQRQHASVPQRKPRTHG